MQVISMAEGWLDIGALKLGGHETRPYGIQLWWPGATRIDVVAGFIPASGDGDGLGGTRPAPTTPELFSIN
jgi:hypothetical protein